MQNFSVTKQYNAHTVTQERYGIIQTTIVAYMRTNTVLDTSY